MEYKFRLKNLAGTEVFDIPHLNFTLTEALNRGVQGSITCSYQALKDYAEALKSTYNGMLKGVYREVEVYREGTLLHTLVLNRKQNRKSGTVTLYISDYVAMLDTRITGNDGLKYTSEDSAVIAWDEINISQLKTNGSFGLTLGTQPTTKNRQRTLRFTSLLDLLVGMSNYKLKDGYDFEITQNKVLNFYYPTKGQSKPNVIFTNRNTTDWTVTESMAGNIFNKVAVLGKGSEEDMVTSVREDTTNQPNWLLSEATLSEKGVEDTAELADRGDKFLVDHDTPEDTRSVTVTHIDGDPNLTDYSMGDSVGVRIEEEDIDQAMRVISRTIKSVSSSIQVTIGFE